MKTQPRALRGVLAGVCAFTMLGLAGPAVYGLFIIEGVGVVCGVRRVVAG